MCVCGGEGGGVMPRRGGLVQPTVCMVMPVLLIPTCILSAFTGL